MELADWVISADDGSQSLFALIDSCPTGLSSQTADTAFHIPGRGSGNAINALMDAFRLTNSCHYMSHAQSLIQRVIHHNDDIGPLELDEPELRWSNLAFLQVLGKYLELNTERAEFGYSFYYVRDIYFALCRLDGRNRGAVLRGAT